MNQIELIATAAFGLEAIVEREVQKLGFTDTRIEDGRVRFKGDITAICKANLWLRCADRVLVVIGEFHCPDFEQLFERTKEMPWEDWLSADAKFPVYAKSVKSMLTATPTVQKAVKKAIVERLKTKHQRIWFDETGAEYPIEVSLLNDRATLTIDTSGEGLHKRGYRQETTEAPLKETLAAALVQLSYWNRDRILVDPCCGSGTIPIEAALIARNMPPGGDRSFAAELWPQVPMKIWTEARKEARDLRQKPLEQAILASDMDPQVIRLARKHASDAGVGMDIHFERKLLSEFSEYREYGCMIVNPPYGERMGDRDSVDQMCVDFGDIMRLHPTWSYYFLTAHPVFERLAGRHADRRRKLYNGRIECTYYQYQGPRPPREAEAAEAEMLASIPNPPSDFKPLKSPIRGPAAGRPLDQFVTTTPLEDGPDQGQGYDFSNRPVPRPPLDFKPLKPPIRGPLAVVTTAAEEVPQGETTVPEQSTEETRVEETEVVLAESVVETVAEATRTPSPSPEGAREPENEVGATLGSPESEAVAAEAASELPIVVEPSAASETASSSPPGEGLGVREPSAENSSSELSSTSSDGPVGPSHVEAAPAPPPSYEIPPGLVYRMKSLDFIPLKPPLRGPFAAGGQTAPPSPAAPAVTAPPVATAPETPAAATPTFTRPIPPPPPGFKPLKPPVRGPLAETPVAPVVVTAPVEASPTEVVSPEPVEAPTPVPVAEVPPPVTAPEPVVPPAPRPMSLAELAARAVSPPAPDPVTKPVPPPVAEVVVDW